MGKLEQEEGVLVKMTFNKKSPTFKKEMADFDAELEKIKKQLKVSQLLVANTETGDVLTVRVFPGEDQPVDKKTGKATPVKPRKVARKQTREMKAIYESGFESGTKKKG